MKNFLIVAALALTSTAAFAQTTPTPGSPASTNTTTVRPAPMNSTTDRMADQNGLQTSSTMSKRDIMRHNDRAARKNAKAAKKMDNSTAPKM